MYKNIIKKLEFSNQTSVMISRYDTYHSIYINIILIPRIKIEKKKYNGILVLKIFILEYENMEYDA